MRVYSMKSQVRTIGVIEQIVDRCNNWRVEAFPQGYRRPIKSRIDKDSDPKEEYTKPSEGKQ
jgi:hypothetical protein